MIRDEFGARFRAAVQQNAEQVSDQLGRPVEVATRFEVLLLAHKGEYLTFEQAADALYLGADDSYVVIDVALCIGDADAGVGWVRPSGHHPRPYADVWDADGIGPFKAVGGIGTTAEWDAAKTSEG